MSSTSREESRQLNHPCCSSCSSSKSHIYLLFSPKDDGASGGDDDDVVRDAHAHTDIGVVDEQLREDDSVLVIRSCCWMQDLVHRRLKQRFMEGENVNASTCIIDAGNNRRSKNEITIRLEDLVLPGSHNAATWKLRCNSNTTDDDGGMDILGLDFQKENATLSSYIKSNKRICQCVASSVIQPWAQCQTHSIRTQLEMGVRYFDLRISTTMNLTITPDHVNTHTSSPQKTRGSNNNNGRIIKDFDIVHGLNSFETLSDVLHQVRDFVLDDHPFEIIVLDVVHLYGFTIQQHNVDLMILIQHVLRDLLVRPSIFYGKSHEQFTAVDGSKQQLPTLNDLWAANYSETENYGGAGAEEESPYTTSSSSPRVFVFLYQQDCYNTLEGLDFDHVIWPRLQYIDSPWLQCSTPSELPERAMAAMPRSMNEKCHSADRHSRLHVLQYVLTPSTKQIIQSVVTRLCTTVFANNNKVPTSTLLLDQSRALVSNLIDEPLNLKALIASSAGRPGTNVLLLDGWGAEIEETQSLMRAILLTNLDRIRN
jgi:hypothetical protein